MDSAEQARVSLHQFFNVVNMMMITGESFHIIVLHLRA